MQKLTIPHALRNFSQARRLDAGFGWLVGWSGRSTPIWLVFNDDDERAKQVGRGSKKVLFDGPGRAAGPFDWHKNSAIPILDLAEGSWRGAKGRKRVVL